MDVSDIANGSGRTGSVGDIPVAVYNDNGKLIVMDNTCTHMGCQTEWNEEDKAWDCPCHGSRYSGDGTVLTGPAEEPLSQLEFSVENGELTIKR